MDRPLSATPEFAAARPRLLRDEDHLRDVLGIDFSAEQMAAIVSPKDAPSVIIAGAGSGKTAVMAARVVWLVGHDGVDPGAILGLTFTNKAASELGARVRSALVALAESAGMTDLVEDSAPPTVSTYHAYAGDLICEYGLLLGFEPDQRVTSDASRFQRAARAVASHHGVIEHLSTYLPNLVVDLLGLDGQLAEHLSSPDAVRRAGVELRSELGEALSAPRPLGLVTKARDSSLGRDELVSLVERYRVSKAKDSVLDFSDQMERGARLALECPEVSQSQRERYQVVLLDEYQDTSVAQRDMLRALFSGPTPHGGLGHCVTAVGDPCQAIYGWRGAAASNLVEFQHDFPCLAGTTVLRHLRVNRRSDARILDVANTLARPYYDTSEHVVPLLPAPGAPDGAVRAACFETVVDEIAWVVDQVATVHSEAQWKQVAILVRTSAEIAALTVGLRERDVPVEVIGLKGLLAQPEVEDVVAALRVVDDVTANPALIRLLTGPRWRIGARDLALLGTRARALVASQRPEDADDLQSQLDRSVRGVDPTEILSLADAVDDPGRLGYSDEALQRFGELSALLRGLRRHVTDSPVDLVRRVIYALDLDIELAAMPGPAGQLGQDNLTTLVETVAEFVGNDPQASLGAVLAYLSAEDEFNDGMEVSSPSDADSVKLLTVHKAKGLEWDVVFVPFLSGTVFPSKRLRSQWIASPSAIPTPLRGDRASQPEVAEWTTKGHDAYVAQVRADALMEERRLGYVAFTRARHLLVTTGHVWGRTQKKPRGPSDYLVLVRDWLAAQGDAADHWADTPDEETPNPLRALQQRVVWPAPLDEELVDRRREVARLVRAHVESPTLDLSALDESDPDTQRLVELDHDLDLLITEARESRAGVIEVPLPATMSPTSILAMRADPDAFARRLARPMPRRPSASARFGTRFHAWVESYFDQQVLIGDGDLPGRDETDIDDEHELAGLIDSFRTGPFAGRVPHAVEVPFVLRLAGQQVSGRIDAVYETQSGFEVVDWKTNRDTTADPLQLAIYRLAWAERHGLDLAGVSAAFYYVRLGIVQRFDDADGSASLPGRKEIEAVVASAGRPT